MSNRPVTPDRAGFRVQAMSSGNASGVAWKFRTYAKLIDKSRSWLYSLPPEMQPLSVKFGRNRLITEPPRDFLQRIAASDGKSAT